MPQPKFPKVLYVSREQDGETTYLSAAESIEELTSLKTSGRIDVATYELKELGDVTITRTYETVHVPTKGRS